MGQFEISELLKKEYPDYLSYKQIMDKGKINLPNVYRGLAKLQKRNEVEFKIIESKSKYSDWIRVYRIKK